MKALVNFSIVKIFLEDINLDQSPERLFEKHIEDLELSSGKHQLSISPPQSPVGCENTYNFENFYNSVILEAEDTSFTKGLCGKIKPTAHA